MVYTGPSDGCHMCRKRRIKCDGARPNCQRCVIYKTKCPGYRNESDFKFVTENAPSDTKPHASSRRRPSKAQATVRSSPSTNSTSSSSNSSTPPSQFTSPQTTSLVKSKRSQTQTLTRAVDNVWDDWSINSFIHDWTIPETSNGMAIGFLEFVPELYTTSATTLDFSLALKAAAFASFANQHNSADMMAKARSSYGDALKALNISLRNPNEATQDHTIATIVLLQIFENITCDDSLSIGNHDAGLRMLIDMRGDEQLDSAQGRSIARIIMGYLHARDVNQRREPTGMMLRGRHRLGYPAEHPARENRCEARSVPTFLKQLSPLLQSDRNDPAARALAFELLQSAASFDDDYARWKARLPQSWVKKIIHVRRDLQRSSLTTIPHDSIVHLYSTPLIACYTSLYRIQFMVLHKIILRVASHFDITDWSVPAETGFPAQVLNAHRSLSILQDFNNDTLASTACAMGEVDADGKPTQMAAGRAVGAYYLLWPLTHIAQDINSTPDQIADATRGLSYIGNVLGVKRGIKQASYSPPVKAAASFQLTSPIEQQRVDMPMRQVSAPQLMAQRLSAH